MERTSKADLSILVRKPNLTFDNVDLSILKDREPRNFKSPFVDARPEVPARDSAASKKQELPVLLKSKSKSKPSTKGKEKRERKGQSNTKNTSSSIATAGSRSIERPPVAVLEKIFVSYCNCKLFSHAEQIFCRGCRIRHDLSCYEGFRDARWRRRTYKCGQCGRLSDEDSLAVLVKRIKYQNFRRPSFTRLGFTMRGFRRRGFESTERAQDVPHPQSLDIEPMYMHYTISEDRSGPQESFCSQVLRRLGDDRTSKPHKGLSKLRDGVNSLGDNQSPPEAKAPESEISKAGCAQTKLPFTDPGILELIQLEPNPSKWDRIHVLVFLESWGVSQDIVDLLFDEDVNGEELGILPVNSLGFEGLELEKLAHAIYDFRSIPTFYPDPSSKRPFQFHPMDEIPFKP